MCVESFVILENKIFFLCKNKYILYISLIMYTTRGIKIHSCINKFLNNSRRRIDKKICAVEKTTAKKYDLLMKKVAEYLKKKKWIYVNSEFAVTYNGISGSLDALFSNNKNELVIVDWKVTCKRIKKYKKNSDLTFASFQTQTEQAVLQLNLYKYMLINNNSEDACKKIQMFIGNIVGKSISFIKVPDLPIEFIIRLINNYKIVKHIA